MLASFREQMADYARGEQLRQLREDRRMSQEEAAHEIGVTTKTLRTWEKGGKIKWPNAESAGRFYGVDPESLVSRVAGGNGTVATAPVEVDEEDLRLELAALRNELVGELALVQDALAEQQSLLEKLIRSQEAGN